MIYVETPTNPMMEVTDIAGVAGLARPRTDLLAVDNTFMSPYFQRPLELGADVVVHSTTKFLNGHSDSIGGALVAKTTEPASGSTSCRSRRAAILSPFDSFLVLRGIKTLAVRMERHEANGRALAALPRRAIRRCSGSSTRASRPPRPRAQQRQATGFGALITFDLGSYAAARELPRPGRGDVARREPGRRRDA